MNSRYKRQSIILELTITIAKIFSKKPSEKMINTNYPIWRTKKKETENKETNKNLRTLRTCRTETNKKNLNLLHMSTEFHQQRR